MRPYPKLPKQCLGNCRLKPRLKLQLGKHCLPNSHPCSPLSGSVSCVAVSKFRGVTTGEEIPIPGNLCATRIECDPIYWVKTQLIRAMTHNLGPDANGDVDVCAHFSAHNRHCAASFWPRDVQTWLDLRPIIWSCHTENPEKFYGRARKT